MQRLFLIGLLFAQIQATAQTARDLDFMEGTWSSRKDGFSFTTTAFPILGGMGFEEISYLDENNREVSRSVYLFREGAWMRTTYLAGGATSTFVQGNGASPGGKAIALEQISYNGRELKPVASRVLMTPGASGSFISDWQSNGEDGEPCWPPDGRHIVFRSNAYESPEICRVEVESGEITRLTEDAGYDGEPVWAPRSGALWGFLGRRKPMLFLAS